MMITGDLQPDNGSGRETNITSDHQKRNHNETITGNSGFSIVLHRLLTATTHAICRSGLHDEMGCCWICRPCRAVRLYDQDAIHRGLVLHGRSLLGHDSEERRIQMKHYCMFCGAEIVRPDDFWQRSEYERMMYRAFCNEDHQRWFNMHWLAAGDDQAYRMRILEPILTAIRRDPDHSEFYYRSIVACAMA